VTVLLMFAAENGGYIVYSRYDARLTVLALGDLALAWALQL
jgi:hypothetical protein